jgi:thiol-disulfide isomerase/thioredoxin
MKLMKKILFLLGLIIAAGCTNAQNKQATPQPPVISKAQTGIPPYHILTTDSVYKTPADLKKNMPIMFVYFAPDCSHCQHMMYELKPRMKDFKDVQVVMITFVTQIKAIQIFYRDFDLKKYPNWIVGTEGYTYVVQKYFDVHTTPYIALYDKNRKLVKAWDKAPSVDEMADAAKKL